MDTSERLYHEHFVWNQKRRKEHVNFHGEECEKINFTNKTSDQIFSDIKKDAFEGLFRLLDGDGDEKITMLSMNLSKIPPSVQKVLEPILLGLREEYTSLRKKEFIHCVEQLFGFLTFDEKRVLLDFNRKVKTLVKKQFKFRVSL